MSRASDTDAEPLVAELVSYAVGCVLGRWDVRFATGGKPAPTLPDPFDPLPVCSPGMLQEPDGLPATQNPHGYPLRIDWDGILVDDPDHPDDIIRRVRDVLEVIWKDRADAIEKEACEILGVTDLRDYFRKPGAGGFWDDHVKRYSKSRRKAPIYWLLQSSKKNYALWIYYHRLDKDILFKALLNYVEPKIRREESRLDELRSQKTALGPAAKGAKKLDKDIDRLETLPLRTPGLRGQAPQGGEPPPRPRPQRRRGPEHRPAPGTRPLEGGQVLLGRPHGRQVRVVVHRQATAGERTGLRFVEHGLKAPHAPCHSLHASNFCPEAYI